MTGRSEKKDKMMFGKIQLTENAYMDAYIADKIGDFTRNAIMVIPGGGYAGLATTREIICL